MKAGSAPLWSVCIVASIASYYDLDDADSSSALLGGVMPHKLFGKPRLLRAALPIVTTPDLSPTGQQTAVGDLNFFDIVLTRSGGLELGLGPQLTLPDCLPIGAGVGKVRKLRAATGNFFVEPQWSVAHAGEGVPRFQIYAGLNLQFPL